MVHFNITGAQNKTYLTNTVNTENAAKPTKPNNNEIIKFNTSHADDNTTQATSTAPLTPEEQAAKDKIKDQTITTVNQWKSLTKDFYSSENQAEYVYDNKGRIAKEIYRKEYGTFVVVPEYDENDNVVSRTHYKVNDTFEIPLEYDDNQVQRPIFKDIIENGKIVKQESMTPDIPNTNYTYFGDFLIKEEEIFGKNIIKQETEDGRVYETDLGSERIIKEYSVQSNYTGKESKMDRIPIRETQVSNDGKYKSVTTMEGNTETSTEYWYDDNGNVETTKTIINTPNSQEIYDNSNLIYSSSTDSDGYTTIIEPNNWPDSKHTYITNPEGITIKEIIEEKDGSHTEIEYNPSQEKADFSASQKQTYRHAILYIHYRIKETRNGQVIYEDTRDENGTGVVTDIENGEVTIYKNGVKIKQIRDDEVIYEDTQDENGTGIVTDIENEEVTTYKNGVEIKKTDLDGEILYEDTRDENGTGNIIENDGDGIIVDTYINGVITHSTVDSEDSKEEVEYKDGKRYHSTTTFLGNSSIVKIEVEYDDEEQPVKEIHFASDGSKKIIELPVKLNNPE